ncbi:hypothetical protein [Bacillus sp. JJ722]
MRNIAKLALKKINEQDEFIKISFYVTGGFAIVLAGYGVGRLIGLVTL